MLEMLLNVKVSIHRIFRTDLTVLTYYNNQVVSSHLAVLSVLGDIMYITYQTTWKAPSLTEHPPTGVQTQVGGCWGDGNFYKNVQKNKSFA